MNRVQKKKFPVLSSQFKVTRNNDNIVREHRRMIFKKLKRSPTEWTNVLQRNDHMKKN